MITGKENMSESFLMEAVGEDQDPKSPTGSAYPIILFFNITNIRLRLRLGMTGVTTMNPLATVGPVQLQPVARVAAMVTALSR